MFFSLDDRFWVKCRDGANLLLSFSLLDVDANPYGKHNR
jgi:hypothetical protein